MTTTIRKLASFIALNDRHDGHLVPATWYYTTADPATVTLALKSAGNRRPVKWLFARSLLGAAFTGPVGEGDVTLEVRPPRLIVRLQPPTEQITLTCDADEAWRFLTETFDAVAPCPVGHCGECQECWALGDALDEALETIEREAMW